MRRIGIGLALVCQSALTLSVSAGSATETVSVRGTARSGERAVANVVVWLDAPNLPSRTDNKAVTLDQRNLAFAPRVLVVRAGAIVDFPNNDRVFHNVFSFRDGKVFDLGLYPVGTSKRITFDRPGLSRIFCNIHPNMAAYIMVVDTPYFAVSDDSGTFTIDGIEAKSYKYHAWRAGEDQLTGTWSPGSPLAISWP